MPRPLVVKPLGDTDEIKVGLAHPCFDHLLEMGRIRSNTLASGPAGSGKTFAAEQVFETLRKLPESQGGFSSDSVRFTVVSCHNEMMPSDIVGPMIPLTYPMVRRTTESVKPSRHTVMVGFSSLTSLTASWVGLPLPLTWL